MSDRNPRIYVVDAFASAPFTGNPAAVCLLSSWLPDSLLQKIASQNNLSETAFVVSEGQRLRIRWFTPCELVPLCGHATLATAFVLLNVIGGPEQELELDSASGPLKMWIAGDRITMDFPMIPYVEPASIPDGLIDALGLEPARILRTDADPNYYAIYEREADVVHLRPDIARLAALHPFAVGVSAPAWSTDIVARYFAPGYGIPEDPATGSMYCALAPYWTERLGKESIVAHQASRRGARIHCEVRGDRVLLTGEARLYLEGSIDIAAD